MTSGSPTFIERIFSRPDPLHLFADPLTRHSECVDLSRYLRMDPHLLVGLLNTELRNACDSLEDLVKKHGLDERNLREKMTVAGYDYVAAQNQFR